MGIRPLRSSDDDKNDDDGLVTFSEDILKIEIHGPDEPALTVIDVPGIFRTATEGQSKSLLTRLPLSPGRRYLVGIPSTSSLL